MQRSITSAILAATALALTACVASHPANPPSTSVSTIIRTLAAPTRTPTSISTDPVPAGPTTVANATSCPLLLQQTAADLIGMRLDRIQRLTQGAAVIGCRFYALQGSALSQSEHLPGPNQPALEITTVKYLIEVAAHNAAASIATAGTNQHVVTLTGGLQGDVFQTRFDPTDHNNDWVLVFNKGTTLVTVKTAVTDMSTDAVGVGNHIVNLIK